MNLCSIDEIKALLSRHGFRFSKAKGQNFLTQSWVPRQIAEDAGIDETCGVLEVGPGIGPLTEQLCLAAKKVVAVEVDTTLKPILAETLAGHDNLEIIFGDVMKQDIPALVAEKFPGLRPMACANLPYYITSPILTALLEAECFDSVTVMVQKEVAQRIAARAGSPDYSARRHRDIPSRSDGNTNIYAFEYISLNRSPDTNPVKIISGLPAAFSLSILT